MIKHMPQNICDHIANRKRKREKENRRMNNRRIAVRNAVHDQMSQTRQRKHQLNDNGIYKAQRHHLKESWQQ